MDQCHLYLSHQSGRHRHRRDQLPYEFIEIEFATSERLFDLKIPINIYRDLLSAADSERMQGSNFYKYYLPPDIPRPRIDFRINSDGPFRRPVETRDVKRRI